MKQTVLTFLLIWAVVLQSRAQGEFRTWCLPLFNAAVAKGSIKVAFSPRPEPPDTCVFRVASPAAGASRNASSPASLSDARGQLRVFGDGIGLTDRRSHAMSNGLLNDPTTLSQWFYSNAGAYYQSLVLAPAPANEHNFYAFYWIRGANEGGQQYILTYALADSRLNGGFGDVVSKGTMLGSTRSPRLTVVRHANNRDYWILTRDLDSRGFQAFLLTRRGVSPTPVVSMAGQALYPSFQELKASPNGRRLTCGARTQSPALPFCVCVYDFDIATGTVTNELVVNRLADTSFSASFSPNSQVLYTTEYQHPMVSHRLQELWQYNLALPTPTAVEASRYWVSQVSPTPSAQFDYAEVGGLQLAPDSTVWASHGYTFYGVVPTTGTFRTASAAVVRQPNVVGPGCRFEPEGYAYLPRQLPGSNLPNVITNMLYAPAVLNHEAGCPEDSVQFWASSAGDPSGLRWDFGEPAAGAANAARGPQAAHRYAQGGTYAVRLTLADGRVLTQAVTVAAQAGDFTGANVFTPNADGLNDAFVPVRAPLPGGRLQVYGRWGQAVFSTADPALRWDGAGAPGGEYFYYLEYSDCQGTTRRRRGTVTLVR